MKLEPISASTLLAFDEDFKIFLKLIDPKRDSMYSKNLYAWLRKHGRLEAKVWFSQERRHTPEKDSFSSLKTYPQRIFIGMINTYGGDGSYHGTFHGGRLDHILTFGARCKDHEFYHIVNPKCFADVSLRFWKLYLERGKRALDPEGRIY